MRHPASLARHTTTIRNCIALLAWTARPSVFGCAHHPILLDFCFFSSKTKTYIPSMAYPLRYVPRRLTRKDRTKQLRALARSRRSYKQKRYYLRPPLASFPSRESNHVRRAKRMYNVSAIGATHALARASGCSRKTLQSIVSKGKGAYYSSGSRPNQTPHSWGLARLASALTGGKASVIDFSLLARGCKTSSHALRLARNAKQSYTRRRVPHVALS